MMILLVFTTPSFLYFLKMKRLVSCMPKIRTTTYAPKITVFLPTRNESKNIVRKIDEVLSMNYPIDNLSLLIIDSSSSDNTLNIAKKHLDSSFRDIVWKAISLSEKGKSRAVNHALSIIETDYFIMMDSDAHCHPDSFTLLMGRFRDQSVGAVCGINAVSEGNSDYKYRSRFNTLRIGESILDSTPIFEGSICAFRKTALKGMKINDTINADDSQLAMIVRKNNFKSIMDPRVKFQEKSPEISRNRRLRRAQGILRSLLLNRNMCFGKQQYSVIMAHSLYFHTVLPWAVIGSYILIVGSFFNELINYNSLSLDFVASLILAIAPFIIGTYKSLLEGSLVVFEATLKLIGGKTLEIWEPERN